MATYYVSSVDGNNADTGADWANAKQTVAGALAVATTTGDVILVDSAHAYTANAAISWALSAGIHVSIISTDRTNGGVLAGAKESVGAANAAFQVFTGVESSAYLSGLTLEAGTNNNNACDLLIASTGSDFRMGVEAVNCTFNMFANSTGASCAIGTGGGNENRKLRFRGCTFDTARGSGTSTVWQVGRSTQFIGCTWTASGGFPGTSAFDLDVGYGLVRFQGCDLSGLASTNWFSIEASGCASAELVDCKLHATPALAPADTWPAYEDPSVTYVNCDSGDTEYKYAYYTREGAITVATGTYASDSATVAGQALSWKIDTTADADEDSPFVTPWVSTWIDSTGSKTLSLELVYDSASNYDDREIWAEIEYLGNASFPISTVYSSRNANPFTGTGTDLTAGSATWTEALTNDNKDKITTTVTVNGKGLARARLYVAVASTTIYLDPQLRVA